MAAVILSSSSYPYLDAKGHPPHGPRPTEYCFYGSDLLQPNVYSKMEVEAWRLEVKAAETGPQSAISTPCPPYHPYEDSTPAVEADLWRSSQLNAAEIESQPDTPTSYHPYQDRASTPPVILTPSVSLRLDSLPRSPVHNTPKSSLFDPESSLSSTSPSRPSEPFTRNGDSLPNVITERPQSATSIGIDMEIFDKPRTQVEASGTLLHLFCPSCPAVYCRGCKRPVKCLDRFCNARHNCGVKRCCADVRALAIFEYLSAFDQFYLDASAAFHGIDRETTLKAGQRRAYLDYVLLHADKYSSHEDAHRFFSVLRRTVKTVLFWLLPEEENNIIERHVAPMFAVSFLSEVLYEVIKQTYWQRKICPPRLENLRQVITELLNTLTVRQDKELSGVVRSPFSIIDQSRGLGAWLWDDDDTRTWSSLNIFGASLRLADWIPFLNNNSP
ncbi:hypothetical protein C0995_013832 [Termitomyces sp. Mi166|nr:hypothetical protein C0995_013832 [Termitomyces sp. Mi166\